MCFSELGPIPGLVICTSQSSGTVCHLHWCSLVPFRLPLRVGLAVVAYSAAVLPDNRRGDEVRIRYEDQVVVCATDLPCNID